MRAGSRLRNRRGAALLLATYLASLMLLYLGGVGLQRTLMEVCAVETSQSTHQAFFLAEAGLDRALEDLRLNIAAVPDDTTVAVTLPSGGATYAVKTVSEPGVTPIVRRITATGSAGGLQQQVTALVEAEEPPLRGLVAGETIWLFGPVTSDPTRFMKVRGRVHAAAGTSNSLYVYNAVVDGLASIGEPHRTSYS
jgi:hypothetical protein